MAHKKEDRLTINEVQDFFKDDDLTEKQKTDVGNRINRKENQYQHGSRHEPEPKADSAKSG